MEVTKEKIKRYKFSKFKLKKESAKLSTKYGSLEMAVCLLNCKVQST